MSIRLAGAACELPPDVETTAEIMQREQQRVESALAGVGPRVRERAIAELGIDRVRVCGSREPYELMIRAARVALDEAGVSGRQVDLILDYSTLPGVGGVCAPLAHRLSSDLNAETSLNLSFKLGGCAGLHLAIKQAVAFMLTDDRVNVALLAAADSPPPGNRSLLPITIQGDAGSAVVLRRGGDQGPEIVATEVQTLGHLHRVITLAPGPGGCGLELRVDAAAMEEAVMPIYYLQFHRLIGKLLSDADLKLSDIDHFVYSNLSRSDRDGFFRAFGIPDEKAGATRMNECGHTFASDLVLNYTDFRSQGRLEECGWLLFASAGIGFTWGVTLVRT